MDKERRELILLLHLELDFLPKELIQTHVQHRNFNIKVNGQPSICLRNWFRYLFFIFHCDDIPLFQGIINTFCLGLVCPKAFLF